MSELETKRKIYSIQLSRVKVIACIIYFYFLMQIVIRAHLLCVEFKLFVGKFMC